MVIVFFVYQVYSILYHNSGVLVNYLALSGAQTQTVLHNNMCGKPVKKAANPENCTICDAEQNFTTADLYKCKKFKFFD
jgi:hypothetical protein